VALVGKGVTFDTGGLDLKPSASMALMKKDMGGAATVLGAFQAIAALELPVHLVAVLGLAENAVDARSYRPGDILRSKAGLTIEISNTDAEGRVVLADALAHARTHRPHFLVDFATLTSACRIALGKELMGLFCDHAPLRAALVDSAEACGDHLWPLPLWSPYRKQLDSAVADLVNAVPGGLAGAILAALFLREFAGEVAWAHLDCYAWSEGESPLFPKGGSGVGVRLCVELMHRLTEIHAHGG
jgi:leucyl aminopeptidase